MSALNKTGWLFAALSLLFSVQLAYIGSSSAANEGDFTPRCYQILQVQSSGINIVNNVNEEECPPQSSCILVKADTTVKVSDEIVANGAMTFGSCIPTSACTTTTCDQLMTQASLQQLAANMRIENCEVHCCQGNLCNDDSGSVNKPPPGGIFPTFPTIFEEFTSDAPPETCGFNHTMFDGDLLRREPNAFSGSISSPNHPESYSDNVDCYWFIAGPTGSVIILNVYTIKLEACCDYLTVTDDNGGVRPISDVDMYVFTTNTISLHFSSDNSLSQMGFSLNYSAVFPNTTEAVEVAPTSGDGSNEGCGNRNREAVVGITETLASPGWPNEYSSGASCMWSLRAPPGHLVRLIVETFITESCCDFVTISDPSVSERLHHLAGSRPAGTRYYSQSNELRVEFTSDGSVVFNGFAFYYTAVVPSDREEFESRTTPLPTTTTSPTTCSYHLFATADSQNISSPGYPESYPPNQNCIWTVTAPPGHYVEVIAQYVQLELCCDRIQVVDPSSSGTILTTGDIHISHDTELQLRFTSDGSIQRKGFELFFRAVDDSVPRPDECGYRELNAVVGVEKYFRNPMSPQNPEAYASNTYCVYTIRAPDEDMRIRFNFESFRTESCCDLLRFYDGAVDTSTASPFLNMSGYNDNKIRYSDSSAMTVLFQTDGSVVYSGFVMRYSAVNASDVPATGVEIISSTPTIPTTPPSGECGFSRNATGEIQYLRSPGYPDDYYGNNLLCTWNLYAPDGFGLVLQFDLSRTEPCCDSVQITESQSGSPTIYKGVFTGTTFMSRSSYLQIKFVSDFSTVDVGFQATYRTISRDLVPLTTTPTTTEAANPCGREGYLAVAGFDEYLESPNYPNEYPSNLDCWWIVSSPVRLRVNLTFLAFATESCCDFLTIYNSVGRTPNTSAQVARFSNNDVAGTSFYSAVPDIALRFTSDGSVSATGFRIAINAVDQSAIPTTTLPPPTSSLPPTTVPLSSRCGFTATATDVSQPLNSPNWPLPYDSAMDCVWTLRAQPGYHVALTLHSFVVEECCDFLDILVATNTVIRITNSAAAAQSPYYSVAEIMMLQFISDRNVERDGFRASFTEIAAIPTQSVAEIRQGACGFNATATNEIQSLYSPGWPVNYGSNLDCWWTLTATEGHQVMFTIGNFTTEQCCDFLLIYDGSETPPFDIRGIPSSPSPFFSTNGVLRLRFKSDRSFETYGFDATFVQIESSQVPTVPATTVASESAIRCFSGLKISGSQLNHDGQTLIDCSPGSSCLDVRATVATNVDGSSFSAQISAGQCVPAFVCSSFTCDQVRNLLPPSLPSNFQQCEIECCYEDMCNKPVTNFFTNATAATTVMTITAPSSTSSPCGFNATASHIRQELNSPGWPGSYESNLDCRWTIRATDGNQVRLQFVSFFTESCCDALTITNVGGTPIPVIKGTTQPQTLVSANGVLHLRFTSDGSIERDGFQANFIEVAGVDTKVLPPAPCGFSETVMARMDPQPLNSPGFPNLYERSLDCEWRLSAPPGMRIRIIFSSFDTESCCDYLEIREEGIEVERYKGTNVPVGTIFLSTSENLVLRFHSDSSLQRPGFQSNFTAVPAPGRSSITATTSETSTAAPPTTISFLAPCGFNATASNVDQPVFSPGWPNSYDRNENCRWRLAARPGKQVQLHFIVLEIEECCDHLKIFDGDRLLSTVKGSSIPSGVFFSTTGVLTLQFMSDDSVQQRGFQAYFRESDPSGVDTGLAPCGFIANATSERRPLNSPGWPENYDNGQDCTWTINADPGKQVVLEILSIDIEPCCDYLRISDDDVDIATLKGVTLPSTPYLLLTSSGRLLLVFHSDFSVTAGGFDAVFYETDSLTTVATTPATTTTVALCGFDETSTFVPQTITSPNYPSQYGSGLDCRWNLNAPSNDTFIEIDLVQIDTEECCDYLLILDDGVRVARIAGTQYPYTYRSHSQSVQLSFSSDGSVQGTGFTLTHVTVDTATVQVTTTVAPTCGFNATATREPQYFFSPGWPGSYKSDETCVWHITAPLGFLIRFNFSTFDTEECCDKLFIRDNGTTTHLLRGSLGTNLVGDSTTNHVVLEFQSDGSIQRSGFYGIFYLISPNEVITTAQTTTATQEYTSAEGVGPECFNVVYANSYVEYIETPGWPYRYPPGFACEWVIHTPEPDQRLFTKFLEIDLACCEDTLWIYDGDNLVGSPITSYVLQDPISIQIPYISTTNSITVRITTGNNYATGFRMNYKIYSTDLPVLACDSNTFLTTPSVIKTPNYPEDYPNDQVCSWTLDARLGQIVVLNISDLQTEVCCDYVEITDGPDQRMIATLKKDSIPENLLYKSSTNLMVVTFHSDSSQTARGLLATVNAEYGGPPEPGACGFTAVVTDEERAFHSPNYPNEYPNDLDCSWLLLSPYPGREVVFTLHDFRSEDCCDSLKINDGKNQMSTEITTMKGRLEQHRYVSTNGGLFLRFTSDASSSYRGFNASYKLVEEDFVFGTITPQPEKEDRDGLRCSVGVAISGAGIEQDTRNRTNCAAGLSCSELSTVIEATIGGASAYVDVTIERCMDTDECLSLKCSNIREFLPPFFPASFSGCSSQCCHDDGSCSASAIGGLEGDSAGDEGGEDGVGGPGTGEGIVSGGVSDGGNVTCNVGVRISTAGFEQNTQELTQCNVDYSCSELTATVFNSETSITAQVTVGQCIPSIACNSVTCEQVQNVVPQSTAQVIQECSTSCCNAEVCVGGDSGGGISSGSSSSQVEEESGGEAGSGEDCLIQDAAFFPGCTYREYANHMMMCATLFYNDYPYREITECGTNLQLYQSCAVGVNEQCLVGDLPTVLGDGVAWDEAQRDMLASQLRNMTSVIVPTYELFCDKMDDEVDEIVSNLVSFINISGQQFCDMESIDYIWRSLAEVLRAIINANDATEFCVMYKNFSMLEADLFHACDFSSLPDIPATRPLKNIMKVAPSVASRSFLPKCLALKTIEDVRPSEPTIAPPVVFTTADNRGCYSYTMDLMFLIDGSGSIRPGEFPQVIEFVKQVVASLDLTRNKVGVMQYSHWYSSRPPTNQRYMETVIGLGEYDSLLRFQVAADRIRHHGYTTYTAHAIEQAVTYNLQASERFRDNCTHKVIIVVTDGKSTDAPTLGTKANFARQLGVTLFAVGIRGYRLEELQVIASGNVGSSERVYTSADFFDLIRLVPVLRSDLANLLTYGGSLI